MRYIILYILFACIQHLNASETFRLGQPIPEVKLKDGRVLCGLKIVGFGSDTVMAKWDGGRGTIQFVNLPDDLQEKTRDFCTSSAASKPIPKILAADHPIKKPNAEIGKPTEVMVQEPKIGKNDAVPFPSVVALRGEAFLSGGTSAGVQVKFAGMKITAYPLLEAERAFGTFSFNIEMPAPIASCVTDSEGRWGMSIPKGCDFLLHAKGEHYATKTGNRTPFEWRIKSQDIQDIDRVMLTSDNCVQIRTSQLHTR